MSLYGFYRVGAGRAHSACEILTDVGGSVLIRSGMYSQPYWIDRERLTPMADNHRFAPVLWAGGWDEYIVDINQIRPMTPKELEVGEKSIARGYGLDPILEGYWLRGAFVPELCEKDECIKIFQHVAGGD